MAGVLLAGILLGYLFCPDLFGDAAFVLNPRRYLYVVYYFFIGGGPTGALTLALLLLAGRGLFSRRSKEADTSATGRPYLAPALFLTVWSAFLMIVISGVPILGAWGFSLWFILARRPEALW